jgi:hypothetical protein
VDLGAAVSALLAEQPAPPRWVLAASLAVAVLAVSAPTWRWTRHVVTIAHEGAHGVVAMATGRQLGGIRLHDDSSGVTVSVGRRSGPGMVAMLASGYPGPALLGLGGAFVLSTGRVALLLWGMLAALALLLVQIRNWFGLLPVVVTGSVVAAVTLTAPSALQQAFAHVLVLFLLLGAGRSVLELQRSRRRRRTGDSDADQLARLTHLPGAVWVAVLHAITVACSAGAVALLLPD